MKVGDYVRTKYGISKILSNPENHVFNIDIFKKDRITLRCIRKKDVIKSSPNIIDLIEVGDIIRTQRGDIIVPNGGNIDELKDTWKIFKNIKSIITKEQFKSMEYEVK